MMVKQGFWIGLAMGFCFALGCGAAITVIPPARAQSTPRWEYMQMRHGYEDGREVNEAGAQGWELLMWNGSGMVFKRPLP